ncbi:MAG: Ca-activated chloride channel family protein [Rhodothermales bacterium]|jgi:Ca-activated chloride channel family protein
MSKSIIDDPRTTAYLLGELNAAESAKVEAALAADPEGQFLLDDLQATADLLTTALAAEPMPELRTPQREQILTETPVPARSRLKLWSIVIPLAAAFALAGMLWQSLSRAGSSVTISTEAPMATPADTLAVEQEADTPTTNVSLTLSNADIGVTANADVETVGDDLSVTAATSGPPPPVTPVNESGPAATALSVTEDLIDADQDGSRPGELWENVVFIDGNATKTRPGSDESEGELADSEDVILNSANLPTKAIEAGNGVYANGETKSINVEFDEIVTGKNDTSLVNFDTTSANNGIDSFAYTISDPAVPLTPVVTLSDTSDVAVDGQTFAMTAMDSDYLCNLTLNSSVSTTPAAPQPIMVGWGEYAIELKPTPRRPGETATTAHAAIAPVPAVTTAPIPNLERQKREAEAAAAHAAQQLELQRRQLAEAEARLAAAKKAQSLQAKPASEQYAPLIDNPFKSVDAEDTSTFSVDVDTAAYANMRRFLRQGQLPPPASVRIEELINYFNYDYPQPADDHPFAAAVEVAQCPWNLDNRLLRVGLSGKIVDAKNRPASNLVFLVDVSGSMSSQKKLPLLQKALKVLVSQLDERDSVGIVTYAGASGVALPSTTANNQETINFAIDKMRSGGSTNGASGIMRAYQMAQETFVKGGLNRVILATDGDFNVGITNRNDLSTLIEGKAKSGVFLSVLGFGMGNLNDHTLEQLADKGNGNCAYIDDFAEARKVLVDEMMGTLLTIAKDVKVQMVFNTDHVQDYRLIGYENRRLAKKDFDDDTKDAGEIGAGHTVTALYELIMRPGAELDSDAELVQLRLRYKQPDGQTSKLMEAPVYDNGGSYADASADFKFAASVASFGMLLRGSPYAGNASFEGIAELADEGRGPDVRGYRQEFLNLVQATRKTTRRIPLPPRQTARR